MRRATLSARAGWADGVIPVGSRARPRRPVGGTRHQPFWRTRLPATPCPPTQPPTHPRPRWFAAETENNLADAKLLLARLGGRRRGITMELNEKRNRLLQVRAEGGA